MYDQGQLIPRPRIHHFKKVRNGNFFTNTYDVDFCTLSLFAFSRVFLEGERVSGKTATDLFCGAREVLRNGAGEIAVTGRGTEKSAF